MLSFDSLDKGKYTYVHARADCDYSTAQYQYRTAALVQTQIMGVSTSCSRLGHDDATLTLTGSENVGYLTPKR